MEGDDASAFIVDNAAHIPRHGRALDLAGGRGRNAVWLARHGLDVTVADISDVALDEARARATRQGLDGRMRFLRLDLEGPLPFAPVFSVVAVVRYLDRERRDSFVDLLVGGGILLAANPTVTNLERNAHPSARWLVERGELARWACDIGLDLVATREDWTIDGMHEASIVARKPRATPIPPASPYR